MPYIIVDGYIIEVGDGEGGTATVTALDGSGDDFSPTFMSELSIDIQSQNIEQQLLDGNTSVTLIGDGPRRGTFQFVFMDDINMTAALAILKRATSFELEVPDRPYLNMTFIRQGSLGTAVHSAVRNAWEFNVGYTEVTA